MLNQVKSPIVFNILLATLMDLSRTYTYFALHWSRLEDGIARVISHVLKDYLQKLEFGGDKIKRQIKLRLPAISSKVCRSSCLLRSWHLAKQNRSSV